MSYKIVISKNALKFLSSQQQKQKERIIKAIYSLPLYGDIKKLAGIEDTYRLRIGDFRILYTVNNEILTIFVIKIGNRGDVYK